MHTKRAFCDVLLAVVETEPCTQKEHSVMFC